MAELLMTLKRQRKSKSMSELLESSHKLLFTPALLQRLEKPAILIKAPESSPVAEYESAHTLSI